MGLSSDATLYLSAILGGALLGVLDRCLLRKWLIGGLLVAGIIGGMLVTVFSPFKFGGTSYYMEGVVLAAGSALALCGYAVVALLLYAWQRMRSM